MTSSGNSGEFPRVLPQERHAVFLELARARQRSHAAVHECGMVQFKDVFLGKNLATIRVRRPRNAACVRRQAQRSRERRLHGRHHTFFEMLGNFSSATISNGKRSIRLEFRHRHPRHPERRLWVTVFKDDDEAARIWTEEIGIDPTRCTRWAKNQFRSMGETGPAGHARDLL